MAILKHIKSRNANYSDAIDYLLFQHDESTGKKIKDEMGRSLLRDEFYMDGLNCDPMSFDKECSLTNTKFHKNKKSSEIKSHHYIISFDPDDRSECGLTGEKAQKLCLDLAKKIFPGYQVLIVTHTDGHNGSGNIHTHIVINSVRKEAVRRQSYMDKGRMQRSMSTSGCRAEWIRASPHGRCSWRQRRWESCTGSLRMTRHTLTRRKETGRILNEAAETGCGTNTSQRRTMMN